MGDYIAEAVIGQLEKRTPREGIVRLGGMKCEVPVSFRDLNFDYEDRIRESQWPAEDQDVFRRELEVLKKEGKTGSTTILQAWHIGDIGFVTLPGELFVEWGLKIKRESVFPWTYPVELGGDYLGYLITPQAWESGGYEPLFARSSKPSVDSVERMVGTALDMLRELHSRRER